jgi:hypothetical protein
MQNKANFGNDKMNISIDTKSNYKEFVPLSGSKNKANSNPIKPKTNPIKAKTKPIQTQSKPILPTPQSQVNKIALNIYLFSINCPIVYMIFRIKL